MTPTVGRVVHFHALYEGEPRAAIVIAVPNTTAGYADLHVFPGVAGADQVKRDVPFTEVPTANCWSWPPRADA